jgi:putative FmdB family regulatory protein
MPAYDYQCRECGSHFERRQKMSEPELNSCPSCNGPVKRLISGGAGAITHGASGSSARPCETTGVCAMPATGGCGSGCGCAH